MRHRRPVVRDALDSASPDAIVAGGGDGTVSSVACGAGRHGGAAGRAAARHTESLREGSGIPFDLEEAVQSIAARHTSASTSAQSTIASS